MNIYRIFGFALYVFLLFHRISPSVQASSCPNYMDLVGEDFFLLFSGTQEDIDSLEPSSSLAAGPQAVFYGIADGVILALEPLRKASLFFTSPLPFQGRTLALSLEVFWKILSSDP